MSEAPLPEHSEEDAIRCLNSCKENLCGTYGTNWGCPPGWADKMDSLRERYDSALVMEKRFVIDVEDEAAIKEAMKEVHTAVRATVLAMRRAGVECMGFADGECGYSGALQVPRPAGPFDIVNRDGHEELLRQHRQGIRVQRRFHHFLRDRDVPLKHRTSMLSMGIRG